ncbi:IS66 family transposase [Methyloprofundus sedimenti]|uniref:IS66 family transposase n=1 Tax=Methyloprofundus sedimenti TaxID=1420851 RepID=UPI0009B6AF31
MSNGKCNIERKLLGKAEIECPSLDRPTKVNRGRVKRTKARNLLERLINYEENVLSLMTHQCVCVLFTNNAAENAIRTSKVHQKISFFFVVPMALKYFTASEVIYQRVVYTKRMQLR